MSGFHLTRRRFVACLAVAISFSSFTQGTSASAVSTGSTAPPALRGALKAAWQQHPSFRVTEAKLAAANARLDAAGQSLYNPELEFLSNKEGLDRTTTAGVSLTLDLSGKRRARSNAAESRVDQAVAEARMRRRDFAHQWFNGWADLLTATMRVEIGERRLALVTRFASLADKQYSADDISGLERDLAALARDEAQVQQSQLQSDQSDAEARFRTVGGTTEAVSNTALPTDTLPEPIASTTDIQQLPDWQVAHAGALAAAREVVVARRNRIADPTLGINGGRIDYGSFSDNVIGVTLRVPLFVRNSYGSEVIAAQAEADAADADAERVTLELGAENRRAMQSYSISRTAWDRWQSSRGTDVERRANLLERLWREGELSTADYLLQLKQTLDTALAGAELEARVWRNYTDYLAAIGQLERWSGLEATP